MSISTVKKLFLSTFTLELIFFFQLSLHFILYCKLPPYDFGLEYHLTSNLISKICLIHSSIEQTNFSKEFCLRSTIFMSLSLKHPAITMQYFPEPHYLITVKCFYKYAFLAMTSFANESTGG